MEYECEKCDRVFPSEQGVRLHTMRAHEGMGPGYGPKPTTHCGICNQDVATSNYTRHLHTQKHRANLEGGESKSPSTTVPAVVTVTESRDNGALIARSTRARFRVLDQFLVLEKEDGSLWLAEQIRE